MTKYEIEHLKQSLSDEDIKGDFKILHETSDFITFLYDGVVYEAKLKSIDHLNKLYQFNIDGIDIHIKIKSELDQLIDSMGYTSASKQSSKEIKSPMPGLVVQTFVQVGQEVHAGDNLLSMEAMKMENIIKAHGTGIIKQILVTKGQSVNKGQLLITFA